jgi:hypothetical protein
LTSGEQTRVNDVLKWAQKHDAYAFYGMLVSVLRFMEFAYVRATHVFVKLTEEVTRVPVNLGPFETNTLGATPRKDQAQVVDKGKSKKVDKSKGKMIKLEKPKKSTPIPF